MLKFLSCNYFTSIILQTLKSNQAHLGLIKLLSIRGTVEENRATSIIPTLSGNIFQGLYIKRLELIGCGIGVVQKGAFKGLDSVLQEISITGNRVNLFNENYEKNL